MYTKSKGRKVGQNVLAAGLFKDKKIHFFGFIPYGLISDQD